LSKVETPNGGYAEVVKHSVSPDGKEIITFSLKYGLIIHAEVLRHKLLNHSVKSNRAIPCKNIRREVLDDPYVPVHFGSNQPGMVADKEHPFQKLVRNTWKAARYPAVGVHWFLDKIGVHKEVCNRLLNPWQWVRETLTGTELDNFYNLRLHRDAQKDVYVLAKAMYQAQEKSSPELLQAGEWHVPYVGTYREGGKLVYADTNGDRISSEEAIKCSAARCARSSYDKHDGTSTNLKNDLKLYQRLIDSDPAHASPCEHIGTPMEYPEIEMDQGIEYYDDTNVGWSHVDKEGFFWSGNFKGWIQYRKLLNNEACWEYKD
jgi:hypothetical protein